VPEAAADVVRSWPSVDASARSGEDRAAVDEPLAEWERELHLRPEPLLTCSDAIPMGRGGLFWRVLGEDHRNHSATVVDTRTVRRRITSRVGGGRWCCR